MTKSNRPQRQETPRKKSGGGMLLGLFLGLVAGVLIAFGVVLLMNKTPLPFMDKYEGAPRLPAKPNGTAGSEAAPAQPLVLPGKPGDKVDEKQRFDFYGILEGKQTATPGTAPGTAPAETAVPAVKPAAKSGEIFFLQAGAFQKAADADNLKARLAMMGMEASVQEADVPGKGKMHRVRIGPLHSPEDMNKVRTQLSQGGIEATPIKQQSE